MQALTDHVFGAYQKPRVPAPIELARELVFGTVEHAQKLSFTPHLDSEQARAHLGPWKGSGTITFGRDGKPTYVQGPDDPDQVLATLRRTAGREGLHYSVRLDFDGLRIAS